jgi:hypothetical protein
MKRKISIAILIFLSLNVYGQHVKVKGGIKGGFTLAKSKLDYAGSYPSQDTKMKVGLLGGGFLNISLKDNLLFQPGLQYVRKGLKMDPGYGDHFYNRTFNYFEVPLNLLFNAGKNKKSPYFLGTGVSPAFNANRYNGSGLKKFDLGVNLLAEYIFPIGFSINLGYTHGILNVGNTDYGQSIHNRNFSATAGYEF